MYKMTFDYHTHTPYSHGKGTVEENVREAVSKGLREIAISDHGPGHLTYGVKRSDFPKMRAEINEVQKKYPQIKIWMSVEANTVCGTVNGLDITPEETGMFDFILAGYHFGVRNGYCMANWTWKHGIGNSAGRTQALMVRNTDMIVNAVMNNDIKILTHPGDKGSFDIAEIAKACAVKGTWMEISTHHPHLTVDEIKTAMKENVKFVISSDAHNPERVGDYAGGLERAEAAGLDLSRIVNLEKTEEEV
jgi:Histidinol phosphatase and related hydrolases of the PHP family